MDPQNAAGAAATLLRRSADLYGPFMTFLRRPVTGPATAFAVAATLIAAITPSAGAQSEPFTLQVDALCEDSTAVPADWVPTWSSVGVTRDGVTDPVVDPDLPINVFTDGGDAFEITGVIDLGWVDGTDMCVAGTVTPTGTVDVDIQSDGGFDEGSLTTTVNLCGPGCAVNDGLLTSVSFTIEVDGYAGGTETATITVTWTP